MIAKAKDRRVALRRFSEGVISKLDQMTKLDRIESDLNDDDYKNDSEEFSSPELVISPCIPM